MKLTVIKAHTAENSYDGYPAHHHWMLLCVSPQIYLSKILANSIYPDKSWADLIMDPYESEWILHNVKTVGYGYKEKVAPEHAGFYAFGEKKDIHDGIDGQPLKGGPGRFAQTVRGGYTNTLGFKSSAEVYELDSADLLVNQTRYNTIDDLPEWAKPTIAYLIKRKVLQGTGAGFDLSLDMVRLLAIMDRQALFGVE